MKVEVDIVAIDKVQLEAKKTKMALQAFEQIGLENVDCDADVREDLECIFCILLDQFDRLNAGIELLVSKKDFD